MKIILFITTLLFSFNVFAQNTTEIRCDSIYKNKHIVIKLINFDNEKDGYDGEKKSILIIEDKLKPIIKDSIFSTVQKIVFADFNNDKIKDVLVQNISDVRSNLTYNLYLYNSKTNTFKKVKGFEEIKNPKYNPKYNIVESYVVSGQDWMSFYKIVNNKVHDYKIEIVDDHGENFEKAYQKAIEKITSKK
jgi:hypothetical protein